MKVNSLFAIGSFLFIIVFTACNFEEQQEKEQNEVNIEINDGEEERSIKINIDGKEDLKNALKEVQNALENIDVDIKIKDEEGKEVESITARDLKKILPRRAAGMSQSESTAQKSGIFGFNIATAEAIYEEDDEKVKIVIMDAAGMGKAISGLADWSTVEIDKTQSDGGFERTINLEGHKAFEKYEPRRDNYELAAVLFDRFVVVLKGEGVNLRKLKNIFEDIEEDLEDLL